MSRVIIKNIPNKVDEKKLRDLFEQCGHVTDVKLQKCSSSGKSRHFGFIGYRSDSDAQAAVKHFNKTFINSVRIEVEIAKPYGDPSIPRPWSKYAKGSSAYAKLKQQQQQVATKKDDLADIDDSKKVKDQQLNHEVHKSKLTKVLADFYDLEKDPAFREFVTLHKKKDKRKTWSNELTTAEHSEETESVVTSSKPKVVPLIESVEAKKPGGKGIMLTRTHLKFEESESDSEQPPEVGQTEGDRPKLSDSEFLKSKVVGKVGEDNSEDHMNPEEDHMSSDEDHMSAGEDHMSSSSDDDAVATPKLTLKMRGLPFSATEQDIKDFFYPVNTKEIRLFQTAKGRPSGRAFVDFYNGKDLQQSLQHDKDFMKNRYIELSIDLGPVEREEDMDTMKGDSTKQKPWEVGTESKEKDESLLDTGRLFVRNLPYTVTEEDVTKLFDHYGPLTEVTVPVDKDGSHPIGYAFITFVFPEHAVKAFDELDGNIFQGRLLHLMPSKNRDIENAYEKLHELSSYKKNKATKQKSQAASSHNWNTLFLGQNAVVDAMATQFNTSKSAILDPESRHSAAVNVALGETQLVEQTRQFLESHGVDLSCFGAGKKQSRSKTVILVKNLPFGTKADELVKLFSTYGGLDDVILPPSGITAVVKFDEHQNAKKAFTALAYSKFKQLPLYLEWAPDGVMKSKPNVEADMTEDKDQLSSGVNDQNVTVFVKNLSFSTTDEDLLNLFAKVGPVSAAKVARKHNTQDPANPLSMGFGFVEFSSNELASKAIKQLQHKQLHGHQLELKISHKKITTPVDNDNNDETQDQQDSCKLLVRNVPFEASTKELKEVFGAFGELKTLRLPKKFGKKSGHRGFAFVEYLTKHDAKMAFDSLHYSTHLYGRRLVLEWAGLDDTVADIRRKTSQQLKLPGATVKRRKIMEQLLTAAGHDNDSDDD